MIRSIGVLRKLFVDTVDLDLLSKQTTTAIQKKGKKIEEEK